MRLRQRQRLLWGEGGECTARSWLHIVYKVWKYLRLYMKTFAYKTVDRWKLWLMIERLNVHNCIQRVREKYRNNLLSFQVFFIGFCFFFFHYHKIIATSFIEGDLCLAGDRSAFVSSIEHFGFYTRQTNMNTQMRVLIRRVPESVGGSLRLGVFDWVFY